jgi:hypothetical protein
MKRILFFLTLVGNSSLIANGDGELNSSFKEASCVITENMPRIFAYLVALDLSITAKQIEKFNESPERWYKEEAKREQKATKEKTEREQKVATEYLYSISHNGSDDLKTIAASIKKEQISLQKELDQINRANKQALENHSISFCELCRFDPESKEFNLSELLKKLNNMSSFLQTHPQQVLLYNQDEIIKDLRMLFFSDTIK